MPKRVIVFTDLDGTLLDAENYSAAEAAPALARLARAGARLVPCTSKTAAEVGDVVKQLSALAPPLSIGPAVVENGAGLVDVDAKSGRTGQIESLGLRYAELRSALTEARQALHLPLVGFGDAPEAEIARRTGLDSEAAKRARQRLGDEPFWSESPLSDYDASRLRAWVGRRGVRLSHGGRFWHLTGGSDKGTAAKRVMERYGAAGPEWVRAAFGDAAGDAPLLEAVEQRFAIRKTDGSVERALVTMDNVFTPRGVGPLGFREGVEILLARVAAMPQE